MILLFSHKLSEEQINDAKENYDVDEFISLPNNLQNIWSNFDPDVEKLDLNEIKIFIKNSVYKNDFALIQGDFGACYSIVNFCKSLEVIPVYATTKRVAKEYLVQDKLVKESIFEHRRFREYE